MAARAIEILSVTLTNIRYASPSCHGTRRFRLLARLLKRNAPRADLARSRHLGKSANPLQSPPQQERDPRVPTEGMTAMRLGSRLLRVALLLPVLLGMGAAASAQDAH